MFFPIGLRRNFYISTNIDAWIYRYAEMQMRKYIEIRIFQMLKP